MAKAARSTDGALGQSVSLKVTLRGTKPPIWRRLLVPDKFKLDALHRAIQVVMGWDNSHLHAFTIDGTQYGDVRQMEDIADERKMSLDRLVKSGVRRFVYTYDFGDDWEHLLVIEKTVAAPDGAIGPVCVAGKRNGPPEDSGGVWGYINLMDILADPAHPEHAERSEWMDEGFEPEAFSLDTVNAALRSAFTKAPPGR